MAKIIDMLTECLPEEKDKVSSIVQFSGQTEILILVSNYIFNEINDLFPVSSHKAHISYFC